MNRLFTLVLCLLSLSAYCGNRTFDKLTEVNKCWKEQRDVSADMLPAYAPQSEKEWIRTHLSMVEKVLRMRPTKQLPTQQRINRAQCLNHLHQYWQAGNFPINEDYHHRTPIFIDKHDNFCAVGYLVKASGHEDVSRMIASRTNLAYVRDMHYPELERWADDNGFTVDELAWIQPGYDPEFYCFSQKIGGGVDGYVKELFVDDATGRMYVGGKFDRADGTLTANNIVYVTQSSDSIYVWHNMTTGVRGIVNAITKYDGKIFAGGSFDTAGALPVNNVAYWDGSAWHEAGCINGVVHDLAVWAGVLFAAGDFDSCGFGGEVNFARWNGADWVPVPGLKGRVNTLEPTGAGMLLGGAFSYGSVTRNVIRWSDAGSFDTFANVMNNEVMDFETYQDSLYAVCKRTDTVDTNSLLMILRENTWAPWHKYYFSLDDFYDSADAISFNTLCSEGTVLNFGGQFEYRTPIVPPYYHSPYSNNCFSFGNYAQSVDSAVNKMVLFNGEFFIGGKFKTGYSWGGTTILNGIARRNIVPVSVPTVSAAGSAIALSPNPVKSGATITILGGFDASYYTLRDVTGRQVADGIPGKGSVITLPNVVPGLYVLNVGNGAGERAVVKVVVE